MGKSMPLLLLAALAFSGWFLLQRYEIQGLNQLRVVRRDGSGTGGEGSEADGRREGTIRVASFNIQVFGTSKASKPAVMNILARIIRQFDVVAIQEVRSKDPEVVPRLVKLVNADGQHYNYVIGPRLGRTGSKEQYAYVFDEATIEVDRSQLYTIDDPDDLLHRPPFVAWFRARGPPSDQAFTFTLVDVHTDPDEVAEEMRVMDEVFLSVRGDGRGEDDVVLLGDFNADDKHLGDLAQLAGVTVAISGTMTNTRQTSQYDNLVFQLPATREYTGRSGVYDFLRRYNLTMEQAVQVSDHLPVWAEFSIYENAGQPEVAAAARQQRRR